MFKELGEFIDNVGRATGRMIEEILSDKDDDGMEGLMGDITDWPDSEDCKHKVVVKIDDDK
jgi:hypothetical protein